MDGTLTVSDLFLDIDSTMTHGPERTDFAVLASGYTAWLFTLIRSTRACAGRRHVAGVNCMKNMRLPRGGL